MKKKFVLDTNMGGTIGNKNAVGNKGGRSPDKATRKKIQTFKGLVLNKAIRIMRGKDEELKLDLIMKAINSILPKAIEMPEDADGEIHIKWGKK